MYTYIYIYYNFGLDEAWLPSNCPNSATIEALYFAMYEYHIKILNIIETKKNY